MWSFNRWFSINYVCLLFQASVCGGFHCTFTVKACWVLVMGNLLFDTTFLTKGCSDTTDLRYSTTTKENDIIINDLPISSLPCLQNKLQPPSVFSCYYKYITAPGPGLVINNRCSVYWTEVIGPRRVNWLPTTWLRHFVLIILRAILNSRAALGVNKAKFILPKYHLQRLHSIC